MQFSEFFISCYRQLFYELRNMVTVSESFTKTLQQFIRDVKLEKVKGSYKVAYAVVELFSSLVTQEEWTTAKDLITLMKICGKMLVAELPLQISAENMVLRLLKIVRDEYTAACHQQEELDVQESLHKIVTSEEEVDDFSKPIKELKESILDHISEFQTELETSIENITKEAIKHIHTNEIILTIGRSAIVESFLKEAAKYRKFEVIVCECASHNYGRDMALNLTKNKIQTTLIADSSIFGIMSRVNKVIIGTQAVMANGGLRAICGTHAVALAAKYYSVPVIVLAGLYKLSSQYLCTHEDKFNQFLSPEPVLKYSEGVLTTLVHVYNPLFDYVPPELVTLFISNAGGNAPSYVYRLLSELYHADDSDLYD
ncbi:translation initiation factor eIF2B subunit beta [Planococcus citri]|uniref:translation initiation factor eIF2B subunit beta n=1 Tax=Planococcus citri TaxID=170843 RepID=UPI0031F9DEA7